ncbi:head-tail connector protein [Escherichia phage AAPEc6]|uniref:Head-tail connector protein n=1 Tax=Escherichia phage AAPEc6 TaxID=2886901 RepID=A0A1P8BK30_9CAUD|nr:head-tail adaptor [Escherichia phage AAPEc6]ANT40790.1 head-tail connector protein [Escherichia phage AAPEc6]
MKQSTDLEYGGKRSKIPKLWERFSTKRSSFLDRAKHYSKLTLPYLMNDKGDNETSQNGWQGVGAQATNHLANKLAQVLFPAQRSFFRVDLTAQGEKVLNQRGLKKTELATIFAQVETRAMKELEQRQFRPAVVEAFKHLIVAGSCMLYKPSKGAISAIPMHHYVVNRDTNGDLLDIILLQEKALRTFDPATRAVVEVGLKGKKCKEDDSVKLYTHAKYLGDGFWELKQSADDIPVGKVSKIKSEKLPFIPLTWKRSYGEDWGRPLAEDYSGDLFVIQFLSEAVARGAALMADIKYLIRPGAQTDVDHFVNSGTGEVVTGVEEDIHIVQLGKYADLTPISAVLEVYTRRIGVVFMMETMTRRDAERVTAVEIQRDALEIEQNMGGVYSLFATTMQSPVAMWGLLEAGESFTSDLVDPVIITGIEALGRMAELDKLANFAQYMSLPLQWPEPVLAAVKWPDYMDWVRGQISAELPFLKSAEEMAQEQEAQMQAQQAQMLEEGVAKAVPGVIQQELKEA